MQINQNLLAVAAQSLATIFNPDKIILFGSYARGTANKFSDVDLLIVADRFENRRQTVIKMYETLASFGLPSDIVLLNKEEFEEDKNIPGTIARPAWQEGRILYERD